MAAGNRGRKRKGPLVLEEKEISKRIDFVRIETDYRGGLKAGEVLRSIYLSVKETVISVPEVVAIVYNRLVESSFIGGEDLISLVNKDIVEICDDPGTKSEGLMFMFM